MNLERSNSFSDNIDEVIILYENILSNKLKRFPSGFWQKPEAQQNIIKLLSYLFKKKLNISKDQIITSNLGKILADNKLRSITNVCISVYKSYIEIIADIYEIPVYLMRQVPHGYWDNAEHVRAAGRYYFKSKNKSIENAVDCILVLTKSEITNTFLNSVRSVIGMNNLIKILFPEVRLYLLHGLPNKYAKDPELLRLVFHQYFLDNELSKEDLLTITNKSAFFRSVFSSALNNYTVAELTTIVIDTFDDKN